MCGCKDKKQQNIAADSEMTVILQEIALQNPDDFSLIRYVPCGSKFVLSPTKVLKQYNLPHYGRRTCNDVFYVHKKDIAARPKMFAVIEVIETVIEVTEEINATDTAIQLANENNIDISTVNGTGKDGKVLKRDVEALLA